MNLRSVIKARQWIVVSPPGRLIRRLGLHRLLNIPYEAYLRARSPITIRFNGKDVRFIVTNRFEASHFDNHWEMGSVEKLVTKLKDDDVLWDIGANIGLYCCMLGVGTGDKVRIHAFEPDPNNAARLRDNIRINNLKNVTVHEVALSDKRGEAEFFVSGATCSVTSSLIGDHWNHEAREHPKVRVQTWTAEDYSNQEGIDSPTIIKCDVEGAEGAVIEGIPTWFSSGQVRLLEIEFHNDTLHKLGQSSEALERRLEECGMVCIDRVERAGGTHPLLATYSQPEAEPSGG